MSEIQIDQEAVKQTQRLITSIAANRLAGPAAAFCLAMYQTVQDSQGSSVQAMKAHLKKEQEGMEQLGAGLNHIMNYLQSGAGDLMALDHSYAKKRITE